jgi:adenosylcobinamide kinase/adenosylcobinamide-phosphate guanylyltransferase
MTTGKTILVSGGARSGKSDFALGRARELGKRRAFVATAEALDREMEQRIRRHRADRGQEFETVEEPRDLLGALLGLESFDVVVVDCLTIWLSNLLIGSNDPDRVESTVRRLARALDELPFHKVLVTNEVGMGVVPDTPLGRTFRDLAGRANQLLARRADEVYLAAMGIILRLKPSPVVTLEEGDND